MRWGLWLAVFFVYVPAQARITYYAPAHGDTAAIIHTMWSQVAWIDTLGTIRQLALAGEGFRAGDLAGGSAQMDTHSVTIGQYAGQRS